MTSALPAEARAWGLTAAQYSMLVAANGVSLPGDGLMIKGAGRHAVARVLEKRGFVRVGYAVNHPLIKARVHITSEGRKLREIIAKSLGPHSHAGGPDDTCTQCIERGLVVSR